VDAHEQRTTLKEPVLRQLPIAEPALIPLTALTGRDTEVSLLRDRWEQAQEGMGQVVSIIGEAGLGKSRLVHTIKQVVTEQLDAELAARAGDDGASCPEFAVVEWRCAERFQNSELFPVSECLNRCLELGESQPASERFDRLARHFDELGLGRPEIIALFAKLLLLPADERYSAGGLTPMREREETFRALREWLKACSDRRPLLFVIEDLHWIDASSLEFLGQFVAAGLHDRILTVLTFRPEFRTPWPVAAHQTNIALNRLTRRQVGELMARETGAALPDALVAQIYERTRGVPLLVEEFSWIIGQTELERAIPWTLKDLVLQRIDRMSSHREIAQMAATLGREFPYEMLAAVVRESAATLLDELDKLVAAHILYVKGQPPQCTYGFKHALLEEALHDALRAEERKLFHRQVAEAMEERFPDVVERQPDLLAQHFTEAGLPEKAVGYWLQAGRRSNKRFANAEAISHLNKGLALLEALEPSLDRDTQEVELLGLLGATTIAARGYGNPEVGPIYERARVICDRLGETPQRFMAMWGNYSFHLTRGDYPLCTELAEEAVRLAEQLNDPSLLMQSLGLRGLAMLFRGNFRGAHDSIDLSIKKYDNRARTAELARLTGEDLGVTARSYLAIPAWYLGSTDEALRLSRDAIALAREIGDPFCLAYALYNAACVYQLCRLGAQTEAVAAEQMQIATEQGFPFWHVTGTIFRAAGMLLQSPSEAALALLERGLEAYRPMGPQIGLSYYLSLLADGCLKMRRFADAHRALDEAFALVEKNDERIHEAELLRLRGELILAESGDEAAAREWFQRAIETARRQASRACELRAATSLARLGRGKHRDPEAYVTLTAVFEKFTEGFDTPDFVDAARLLRELSNDRMREDFAAGVEYVRACIPPPMEGKVAVDWRYIPSSTLGGDTIGYHWIDADHFAVYLIDVTGHGLDSALHSVSISNVLRSGSLAGADMRQPDQVLAMLNDSFQGRQHSQKFFTIWYGIYCASTRVMSWSGGGHHPALLLRDGADEAHLSSTGPMMGLMRGARFPATSCPIPPGARLLIFSDGVFEIRRNKQMLWDLPACMRYLAAVDRGATSVMDELLAHVRHLRGSQQLDDDFSIIETRFE
jgi:tetratricopeptide (TPR) repeat protein